MLTAVDPNSLTSAAENLIKVACHHVETASAAVNKETLDHLKSVSTHSASISKKLPLLQGTIDAKITALSSKMELIKVETVKLNSTLLTHAIELVKINSSILAQTKEMTKAHENTLKESRLTWALDHTSLGNFGCYYKNQSWTSETLIEEALLSFRKGSKFEITHYTLGPNPESFVESFADKFVDQLFGLLGVKPRIEVHQSKVLIHYS